MTTRAQEKGFTLVELMVAMLVLLILVAAALTAFDQATRVNEHGQLTTDVNQNLRAGMNLMVRDLVQAGVGIPTGGIPIPNGGGALAINRPSPPGLASTFPAGDTVLPAVSPGGFMGPVVAGQTDMVTMLYADNTLPLNSLPLTAIGAFGESMTVDPAINIAVGNTAIQPGDLIMFSNAQGNAIQQVTRISGGQTVFFDGGDFFNLNNTGAPNGTLIQLQTPPGSGTYPPTTATRIWMVTYYIDNVTNANVPRLVRQVNFNPGQPVALAAENLQISYDFVDGVVNPTNQKITPAGLSPNLIRKVNLYMGARSGARYSKTNDFVRNGMATQVGLRSLAYVDRYR
jgi:prepilin-type N-terminal cleavage/methylation domain-containing protein